MASEWASATVGIELNGLRATLHVPGSNRDDHPQQDSRIRWFSVNDHATLAIRLRLPQDFARPDWDGLHVELTFNNSVTYIWSLDLRYLLNLSRSSGYCIRDLFVLTGHRTCDRGQMVLHLGSDANYTLVQDGPRISPPVNDLGTIQLELRRTKASKPQLGEKTCSSMKKMVKSPTDRAVPHVLFDVVYTNVRAILKPSDEDPAKTERSATFEFRFGSEQAIKRDLSRQITEGSSAAVTRPGQGRTRAHKPAPAARLAENPRHRDSSPSGRRSRSPARGLGLSDRARGYKAASLNPVRLEIRDGAPSVTSAERSKKVADNFVDHLKIPISKTPYPAKLGPPPVVSANPPRRPDIDLHTELKQHAGMNAATRPASTDLCAGLREHTSISTTTRPHGFGQLQPPKSAPGAFPAPFESPRSGIDTPIGSTAPNTPLTSSNGDLDSETRAQIARIERSQRKGVLRAQILPLEIEEEEELQEKYNSARLTDSERADLKKAIVRVQRKREPLEIERNNIKFEEQKEELLKKAQAPR